MTRHDRIRCIRCVHRLDAMIRLIDRIRAWLDESRDNLVSALEHDDERYRT